MSATVKIINHLEVSLGGELVEIGSRTVPSEITIAGNKFEVIKTITNAASPDAYNRQVLWESGDGGISDFDVLAFYSDAAVLLELTIDRAVTPEYATLNIAAGVPLILSTDDLLAAITVDNTVTTMDQIDQIAVQNNAVTGSANVRLLLLT